MALVHVVATKKKKPAFVDHHQMVNLSMMSGFMSVDRSNISETSSKSLERFRSDNNHSRLSNGSGGGGGSSSGPGTAPTRIINVGLTRQRSLPRSSPSPTNIRVGGGRASSPFADTAVGVSQYAGNNTLHSLLGVQQFTSATNRHFRENNNRSQEGRGTGKVTTTRSSPRASAAEGEDDNDAEETEEDLLDFDFLHANTESHDIILGETCVGLLWCGGLDMETHDFIALQLFRLVQGGNGSEEMEMVKVHAWNDVFPISSMAVVHVAHVHDNPHAMSVPMVICGGSQGIQMSVVGATVFQPFSWTQTPSHSSSSPTLSLHDENDDSKWLDHLIGGTNATSSSRRMDDDDGADGEDEDETYVTTTASSSSFFTVLTAQPARKIIKVQLYSHLAAEQPPTTIPLVQDLILAWKQVWYQSTANGTGSSASSAVVSMPETIAIWLDLLLVNGSTWLVEDLISFVLGAFRVVGLAVKQKRPFMKELLTTARQLLLPPTTTTTTAAVGGAVAATTAEATPSQVMTEDVRTLVHTGIHQLLSTYFVQGSSSTIARAILLWWKLTDLRKAGVVTMSADLGPTTATTSLSSFDAIFLNLIAVAPTVALFPSVHATEGSHLALRSATMTTTTSSTDANVGLRFLQLLQSHFQLYQATTTTTAGPGSGAGAGAAAATTMGGPPPPPPLTFQHPSSLVQIFLEAVFLSYDRDTLDTVTWQKLLSALSPVVYQLLTLVREDCLEHVDPTWPPAVLAWIGRTDLYANAMALPLPATALATTSTMNSSATSSTSATTASSTTHKDENPGAFDEDGLESLQASSLLRFPEDTRVREVCRMLRSSKPVYLKVDRTAEINDVDYRAKLVEKLSWLLRRSFACSVGRGMLTISTAEPLMAEKLPIPPLSIQGRVPPLNSLIAAENLGESIIWPEFHNGTAAALRVGPRIQQALRQPPTVVVSSSMDATPAATATHSAQYQQRLQSMRTVTRNWIMYNKTASLSTTAAAAASSAGGEALVMASSPSTNAHAGFLFGLGLFGHLQVLTITDICDYLTQGHEPTTIAVLIGVSISKMATADAMVAKTLFLHLPSLIPTPHWGIEISPTVQCAALVGIGFLFTRSCNRLMIQFLLEELFRKPTSDRCECRESLSLCAAWSLAMIALPRLTKIEDRLFHLIEGGKRPSDLLMFASSGASASSSSSSSSSSGATPLMGAADANAKSSRILEGDLLNVDVTSPGATLALGLLYQRSHDDKVLRRLELPKTMLALDGTRPDHLFYRCVARVLIQWDAVQPSLAWMEAQLPPVLASARQEHVRQQQQQAAVRGRAFMNPSASTTATATATAGSSTTAAGAAETNEDEASTDSTADSHRHAASAATASATTTAGTRKYVGPYGSSRRHQNQLDPKVTLTLIINIYAGLAQGLGLVYAGTFDERVKALLLERLQWLQSLRENKTKENFCTNKMTKYTVESAMGSTSLALACVMAGSGDLDCLRLFRMLRWKVDVEQTYGSHMVYGMAIGMLFLGGGKYSLKRDPVSVACLLMSMLPRYPNRTTDQQTHLQALRHLYVLAVEPRVLQTIDVSTGVPVSVDLELELVDGRMVTAQAPGLLPELLSIHRISVKEQQRQQNNVQFYPCSMDLQYLMGQHGLNHHQQPAHQPATTNPHPTTPGFSGGTEAEQESLLYLRRQVASPQSPWKAWAAAQQSHGDVALMHHCTLLPPLYVKVKPSTAIVSSEETVNTTNEANADRAKALSFLLQRVFAAPPEVPLTAQPGIPSPELVENVKESTYSALLKQLWQYPNVQQAFLSAMGN
eukprot:gene8018-5771_t